MWGRDRIEEIKPSSWQDYNLQPTTSWSWGMCSTAELQQLLNWKQLKTKEIKREHNKMIKYLAVIRK